MSTTTDTMRVRIHRGAHEVGGSCVEVAVGRDRLVLDVGAPLGVARDQAVALPPVPGLGRDEAPSVLGVVVSHPHLDHYGLVDLVHPDVPVYCGAGAAALVEAASFFAPGPRLTPTAVLEDGRPLRIGPFTVTPHLVDHSGYDAYAVVVEGGGRRLMYSGDLRGHGRKRSLFTRMLASPPADIDALLLEGTHVPGSTSPRVVETTPRSESRLEREMAETFGATEGLVAVVASAQNVDRVVTAYRAARRAGRVLLLDLYTTTVMAGLGRSTLPQPGFPSLGVFVPRRQRVRVKTSGEFHRTAAVRQHRVFAEDLLADPGRFVVLSGSGTVPELVDDGALTHGTVVWSLWRGYLDEPSGARLTALLERAGIPLVHHHTSGHAPVSDLVRLVQAVDPGWVVPIHTEGAAAYSAHFPRVAPHDDGEWWTVPAAGHRVFSPAPHPAAAS